MNYNKEQIEQLFTYWNKRIADFSLPEWNELPMFDLYMDQVIKLLNKYLDIYAEATNDDKGITQSMINNYVKLKIIPSPEKKRYSKIHLAYLIIVCVLKQTLSISTIQNIIPLGLDEEDVKKIYTSFVANQRKSYETVSRHISDVANLVFETDGKDPEKIGDLIIQVASSANVFKMISEIICTPKE